MLNSKNKKLKSSKKISEIPTQFLISSPKGSGPSLCCFKKFAFKLVPAMTAAI